MRHVVAADLHLVDDRGLALRNDPAEIHDRLAVGAGAPQHIGADLHVDVAVVVVERLKLAGRVLPLLLVEVRGLAPPPQPQQPGPFLLPERIERLQLLTREAPAADNLERADLVGVAFAQLQDQRRLAARLIDQQGVPEHLEVHVALRTVELGEAFAQVGGELLVVVLPRLKPPEALGPRLHVLEDRFGAEVSVALDADQGHSHAASLLHIEDHSHGRGIVLVDVQRARVRQVEPLRAIQRIDARARVLHGRGVDRAALGELDLVAHGMLAEALHAAHGPFHEHGALAHPDQDDGLARRGLRLLDPHVVVLAGAVEGEDGALHIFVGEDASRQQAARLDHGDGRIAPGALDGDGVRCQDRRMLALRAARARSEHGKTQEEEGDKAARHAFKPERARNARRSLSGATSTSISSPRAKSPTRIFSERGSSTYF